MTTEKKTEKDFLMSGRRGRRKTALSARTAGALAAALVLAVGPVPAVCSGNMMLTASAASGTEKVTLRIANWEEYIDEGGWDEEEAIDLDDENSTVILGENSMIEDFEDWYLENYGVEVNVEYSTFGSNEDLYNQLTLGNDFDLVCPSE